ncbi:alanine racemase, partial [Faecalibacterium sp. DFI.5.82]|uniref:alanine racemase n=1 Tax=Faecalibacterium sp. DFI.5.82 TaxID=3031725 RepID=UPI0023AF69F6
MHLAVDTGMGRIGFALRTDFDAAIAEAIAACTLPGLEMTGLFQHFSVADDTAEENIAYTAEQHRLFVQAC